MSFSKKILIITLSLLGIIILGGGIFWIGKKVGGSKSPSSELTLQQKILQTQKQLTETQKQLANETNNDQKQKLAAKVKQLEQELTNLKNQQPTPPTPPQQPTPPVPPRSPNSKIETELSLLYVLDEQANFSNNAPSNPWEEGKERILIRIAKNNPILKGKDWNVDLSKFPNLKISFLEKDASKYEEKNSMWGKQREFFFDDTNNLFTLTFLGPWPTKIQKP